MSSAFPDAPQIMKGALVVYPTGKSSDNPRVVTFQYNPDQVRRTIADRAPAGKQGDAGAAKADAMRVTGPPKETLTLTITLDATDQRAEPDKNPNVVEKGLLPALFLLETLLYPTPESARANQKAAKQGEALNKPLEKPSVLAVWGKHRSAPVKVTSFSITEESFDSKLNPVRAKIELAMEVLADVDVDPSRVEAEAYLAYQKQKHNLAAMHENRDGEAPAEGPRPVH
ncbi:MAG: hypothetical protein QOD77_275 [Thermoplasmata archaeon]|jgi:hypothetical protein|nr:hypothetical protein [Thermoplasmata archaeon]